MFSKNPFYSMDLIYKILRNIVMVCQTQEVGSENTKSPTFINPRATKAEADGKQTPSPASSRLRLLIPGQLPPDSHD